MGLAMIFGCRGQILKELGILGVGKPEKEWIAAAFSENLYIFLEKTESICLQHFWKELSLEKGDFFNIFESTQRGSWSGVWGCVDQHFAFSMRLHRYVCIAGQRCHWIAFHIVKPCETSRGKDWCCPGFLWVFITIRCCSHSHAWIAPILHCFLMTYLKSASLTEVYFLCP